MMLLTSHTVRGAETLTHKETLASTNQNKKNENTILFLVFSGRPCVPMWLHNAYLVLDDMRNVFPFRVIPGICSVDSPKLHQQHKQVRNTNDVRAKEKRYQNGIQLHS